MRSPYSAPELLAQEALDQLALLQEALDQLALDHEADDQLALLQEALDQLALDHEAWFQAGSLAAAADHPSELNTFRPVEGSVTTNLSSPAFGLARPSDVIAPAMSRMPTPSAPAEL